MLLYDGRMCHMYRAQASPPEVFRQLGLVAGFSERLEQKNLFPMYDVPIVRYNDAGELVAETRQWGWLPAQWKPSDNYKTRKKYQRERINARCETIHTTWGFRQEFQRGQRCVLLAEAFNEPFQVKQGGNWFTCNPPLVGIAGLWAHYSGDEVIDSCTMLTTEANDLVREYRTGRMRMPVLLDEHTVKQWLDPDRTEPGHFAEVFTSFDPTKMLVEG